ncbi:Non-specific serine/threonine protein kinase [Sulfidibacter corallicola]|uniref:Serine/threonine protein kinase n=1 Tax=Sulfidibacter corallicola TaxID=2818388 RepID=A0A8A4TI96_SULCO|nr:serine/threonine-protein kinase [Sulfidibacter corallicola]QTD49769.1 serine/threonine protein kinase [Sulfidibacter corallicola]
MDLELLAKVNPILERALDRDPADRVAFLDEVCKDQPLVRHAVEDLLRLNTTADAYLEITQMVQSEMAALFGEDEGERIGRRFGPYRTIAELGRGGMGRVYLAERDDGQYSRQVALKLMAHGLHTDRDIELFRGELSILGRLDHPHIAALYDSGITQDGLPYFIMEYLDALPLHVYADEHRLSPRQRLTLFLQICDAVQYAHANLVIHRDIKPTNILVTADGRAKLLDFGIARVLGDRQAQETSVVDKLMTPEFAAPEQLLGGRITVATDIYALGGLLYRLLTGARPIEITGQPTFDMFRTLATSEPQPASQCTVSAQVAAARSTTPKKLKTYLQGDLDCVLAKALAKSPADRYASVEAFAQDLRHFLAQEPVAARSRTLRYRTDRFLRRNRVLAGVGGSFLLLILGFALAMTALWNQARNERDIARREKETNRQISDFLIGLFETSDPEISQGREVTARELLERGQRTIQTELADQPDVRANMLAVLGKVHHALGRYGEAEASLREWRQYQESQAAPPPELAQSIAELASIQCKLGHFEEADRLTQTLVRWVRAGEIADPLQVADLLATRNYYLREVAEYEEALVLAEEVLTLRRTHLGPEAIPVAEAMMVVGKVLNALTRRDEAIERFDRGLEIYRAAGMSRHPGFVSMLNQKGLTYRQLNDLDRAESAYREALAIGETLFPEHHPERATAQNNLATILSERGQYEEAERLMRSALASFRVSLGEANMKTAGVLNNLGELYMDTQRFEEGTRFLAEAFEVVEKIHGLDHPTVISALSNRGLAYYHMGQIDKALADMDRVLAIRERVLGPDHPALINSLNSLGAMALRKRDMDGAIQYFQRAIDIGERIGATRNAALIHVYSGLANCHWVSGDVAEAVRIQREALRRQVELLGEAHPMTQVFRTSLAQMLLDHGRMSEAQQVMERTLPLLEKIYPPTHYRVLKLKGLKGQCYYRLGRFEEAESLLVEVHRGLEAVPMAGPFREKIGETLAELYQATGRSELAAKYSPIR